MKLNIAIVDDRQNDRERLRVDLCSWRCPDGVTLGSVECCPNGEAMLEQFEPGKLQLVFMDIYMEEMNGIETAKRLRALDANVLIVFLTTSREFAFDAFPVHPFDYIVKPYDRARLEAVLNEAVRVLSAKEPAAAFRIGRVDCVIQLGSLSSVMSSGHGVELSLADGRNLTASMTFSEAEGLLTAHPRFLLCNRGLIVNMEQVASTNGDVFRMKNGQTCPIRVRGRAKVLAAFSQYQMFRLRGKL